MLPRLCAKGDASKGKQQEGRGVGKEQGDSGKGRQVLEEAVELFWERLLYRLEELGVLVYPSITLCCPCCLKVVRDTEEMGE